MNAHQKTRQPRFVLVSSYFPPIVGGTSTVLRNLVSQISPDDVSVITEYRELHADAPRADTPSGVNIKTTSLPPALFRRVPYIWRWERYLRFALILRVRDLTLRAIRKNRPDCILGIYPNWPFLIGAYLAPPFQRITSSYLPHGYTCATLSNVCVRRLVHRDI